MSSNSLVPTPTPNTRDRAINAIRRSYDHAYHNWEDTDLHDWLVVSGEHGGEGIVAGISLSLAYALSDTDEGTLPNQRVSLTPNILVLTSTSTGPRHPAETKVEP